METLRPSDQELEDLKSFAFAFMDERLSGQFMAALDELLLAREAMNQTMVVAQRMLQHCRNRKTGELHDGWCEMFGHSSIQEVVAPIESSGLYSPGRVSSILRAKQRQELLDMLSHYEACLAEEPGTEKWGDWMTPEERKAHWAKAVREQKLSIEKFDRGEYDPDIDIYGEEDGDDC